MHTLLWAMGSLLALSQAMEFPELRASLVTYNDANCTQPAQRIDMEPTGKWKHLYDDWGSHCVEDIQPGLLPVAYKIIGKKNLKRKIVGQIDFVTDTVCMGATTGSK